MNLELAVMLAVTVTACALAVTQTTAARNRRDRPAYQPRHAR